MINNKLTMPIDFSLETPSRDKINILLRTITKSYVHDSSRRSGLRLTKGIRDFFNPNEIIRKELLVKLIDKTSFELLNYLPDFVKEKITSALLVLSYEDNVNIKRNINNESNSFIENIFNLKRLDLSINNNRIPAWIDQFPKIYSLNIRQSINQSRLAINNNTKLLDFELIYSLENLRFLQIDQNFQMNSNFKWTKFSNLEILIFRCNDFKVTLEQLTKCNKLEFLGIMTDNDKFFDLTFDDLHSISNKLIMVEILKIERGDNVYPQIKALRLYDASRMNSQEAEYYYLNCRNESNLSII